MSKRQRNSKDVYSMISIRDALTESIFLNDLKKKYDALNKNINNIEIKLLQNNVNTENLTKEIAKLSEVLMFYIDKKENNQMEECKLNKKNPEYIS